MSLLGELLLPVARSVMSSLSKDHSLVKRGQTHASWRDRQMEMELRVSFCQETEAGSGQSVLSWLLEQGAGLR